MVQRTIIHLVLLVITCFFFTNQVNGLECYVCKDQEDNKDKCVETVKICEGYEDRCLTSVRWGSVPYFAASGAKQYFISKFCSSERICDIAAQNTSQRCDRIWYNDWECVECCTGDRCNYYVTLTASFDKPSGVFVFLTTLIAAFLLH